MTGIHYEVRMPNDGEDGNGLQYSAFDLDCQSLVETSNFFKNYFYHLFTIPKSFQNSKKGRENFSSTFIDYQFIIAF